MNEVPGLVLVTTSFPIQGDGSEAAGSFVKDLAEELGRHMPVRVVAPGRQSLREDWATNVEVYRYASPTKALSNLKAWKPGDALQTIRVLKAGAEATRRAVAAGSTKHVLALWALPSGYWARGAARLRGIPYSIWALGSDIWSLGKIPIARTILRKVIRDAANRYADGFQLGEDAAQIGGKPFAFLPSARRIDVIDPLPVRARPPYRLLFLGRWHHNKGIDLLLDALALLNDDDWQKIEHVEIQGGGPMEPLVRNWVARLRVAGRRVTIGGFLTKAEAEAAIVRADWVLIPSRIESIPVIFSDAMKLGRPVIAMPVGDFPRLIGEAKCGVLAECVTAQALSRSLQIALAESPRAYEAAWRLQARRFELSAIAEAILSGLEAHD